MELFDYIRSAILETFPDPRFDPEEERKLKEKDEVRKGIVMIISRRKKED